MLDVQDLLILGSGMGLLTNLIILGNFLLKCRTKRQKNITRGSSNKGLEPKDLGVSLQGCWRTEVILKAGSPKTLQFSLREHSYSWDSCTPRHSSAMLRADILCSTLLMLKGGARASRAGGTCAFASCPSSRTGIGSALDTCGHSSSEHWDLPCAAVAQSCIACST